MITILAVLEMAHNVNLMDRLVNEKEPAGPTMKLVGLSKKETLFLAKRMYANDRSSKVKIISDTRRGLGNAHKTEN
jgi:hypothetical protein